MKEISERSENHIIQIKPWEDKDLDLLFRIKAPEMMEHLGGTESKEQVLKRTKGILSLVVRDVCLTYIITRIRSSGFCWLLANFLE
jgi:hypothetical protein